jgi:hypothetical protein
MTSDSLLLVLFGLLCGFALGYTTGWRQALKLEHFGVPLWKWNRPFDAQATPDNVTKFERQSAR